MAKATEYTCSVCGQTKERSRFYSLPWQSDNVIHTCKMCADKLVEEATVATGNKDVGLWTGLMQCGVPLISEVYKKLHDDVDNRSMIGRPVNWLQLYLTYMAGLGKVYKGIWESDMSLGDFLTMADDIVDNTPLDLRAKWDRVWGDRYNEKQCQWLDDCYARYTAGETALEADPAKIFRYRDLCKDELKQFEGDTSKELTDEILKLLKVLKLDQFKDNHKSEMERLLERQAWEIENTKPAECEDLEQYKDHSGFLPVWEDIMRCMRNVICGTKNYPDLPPEER